MADLSGFLIYFSVASLILLGLLMALDMAVNWSVKNLTRTREPLPRRERDLLGEDYRDCVRDYAAKVDRRRRIVKRVAGVRSE